MMISLFSCSKAKSKKNKKAVIVQPDNVKQELDKSSSTNTSGNTSTPDIDLTKMSVTMIYSQIFKTKLIFLNSIVRW